MYALHSVSGAHKFLFTLLIAQLKTDLIAECIPVIAAPDSV